ncbi:MAG: hypothetical protein Q4D33_00865 [Prevotellaceae bacterium]|nr:hypothetical protein [Prevotellaceae bacterium]
MDNACINPQAIKADSRCSENIKLTAGFMSVFFNQQNTEDYGRTAKARFSYTLFHSNIIYKFFSQRLHISRIFNQHHSCSQIREFQRFTQVADYQATVPFAFPKGLISPPKTAVPSP